MRSTDKLGRVQDLDGKEKGKKPEMGETGGRLKNLPKKERQGVSHHKNDLRLEVQEGRCGPVIVLVVAFLHFLAQVALAVTVLFRLFAIDAPLLDDLRLSRFENDQLHRLPPGGDQDTEQKQYGCNLSQGSIII